MFQSLAEQVGVAQHIAPATANTGSYGITGTAVDMQGWEGCLFIIEIGAMVAAGTFDAKAQSAAASGFGTAHDITNAALTQLAAASGGSKCYAIDVKAQTMTDANAGDRYLRIAAQGDGSHNVTYSVTAITYRRSGALPQTGGLTQLVKV